MSNDGQDDGFDDYDSNIGLMQGGRVVCLDGVWAWGRDGTKIPEGKRFLCLGTGDGLQRWEDGRLVEERIKKPGVPFEKTVNELNAEIPQDTWEETDFGPREPWSHQFAVYLCDADDGSIYTHINSTAGAAMATRELKSRVKWKRSLFGGRKLLPVVTLGSQIVSQKYKKLGPNFIIVDWRDLGPELPPVQTAPLLEKHADPIEQIGQPLTPPKMSEVRGDELPWNDSPLLDAPARVEELQKEAATPPPQHKPAAAPKPTMTKKGVQKVAGARR